MKIGTLVPQGWVGEYDGWDPLEAWQRTVQVARQAERLGFESIWLFDHFHTIPRPTDEITFSTWYLGRYSAYRRGMPSKPVMNMVKKVTLKPRKTSGGRSGRRPGARAGRLWPGPPGPWRRQPQEGLVRRGACTCHASSSVMR